MLVRRSPTEAYVALEADHVLEELTVADTRGLFPVAVVPSVVSIA
jgi:hypothetical protein